MMRFARRGGPRPRRPDDNRFLPKDQQAWMRLVRRARQAARNPGRFADELDAAARACGRAVPPPGHAHRGSVFLQLLTKGRVYPHTHADMRAPLAAELERLAESCAEILERPAPEARRRADLE